MNDQERSRAVRIIQIAELLGVSHQPASKIAASEASPSQSDKKDRAVYGVGADLAA